MLDDKRFKKHPKNLEELFDKLNKVLTVAPDFNTTALVGTPMSAILIWTMGSPQGFAAYKRKKINTMFREILKVYKNFLDSPQSRYVLTSKPFIKDEESIDIFLPIDHLGCLTASGGLILLNLFLDKFKNGPPDAVI